MEKILKVTLLSDTCLGGNNSMNGVVDTEIIADAQGIPCIPGKRIKGLFREMANELKEFGLLDDKILEEVFGKSGNEKEAIHFQTLYPEGYEDLKTFLVAARQDVSWKEYAKKSKVLDYYTAIRSQTALEDSGIAKKNSLRMIRVVKRNHIFYGKIECPDTIKEKQIAILETCAKMVRHIGINRTRGMGNVKCELLPSKTPNDMSKILENLENNHKPDLKYHAENEATLYVKLSLKQPCSIDNDYISGGVLRGMYAAKYAQYAKNRDLHKCALFQDLFLKNKVKFGYCWPVKKSGVKDIIYWPTPNSCVEKKNVNDGKIYDLANVELDKIDEKLRDKERCKTSFVNISEGAVYEMHVERKENYHHRRPEDRSVGHALKSKSASKTSDGQLYTREFLCEGQEFYGEIRGEEKLLDILTTLLPSKKEGYIGASKTAEYGKIEVLYETPNVVMKSLLLKNRVVITMLSPMVVLDDYGNETTDVEKVVKTILGTKWNENLVIRSYCKEEVVSGYNAKWNMPIVQRNVLIPGSEIVIYGIQLSETEMKEFNGRRYGLYQNEGYGHVIINGHGNYAELCYAELSEENTLGVKQYSAYTDKKLKDYIDICLKQEVLQLCSEEDSSDFCYNLRKILQNDTPNSHALSGLQRIYKTSGTFEEFSNQIKDAASRAKKSNSDWFNKIHDCIFGINEKKSVIVENETQTPKNWECDNEFYKNGYSKIKNKNKCSFDRTYKKQMQTLLEANAYQYFCEIFGPMIYDVHLELDNKGGK